MAPEVIKARGYGTECDIWAVGIMLYEFVIGILPFGEGGEDDMDIAEEVVNDELEFPEVYVDYLGRRLIKGLLEKDPDKRLGVVGCTGFSDIKNNKYFQAGVKGDLFSMIEGREMKAPVVPECESYEDATNLGRSKLCTMSDEEELGVDDVSDSGGKVLDVFNTCDLKKNGVIDRDELKQVLTALNPGYFTDDVLDKIMLCADRNRDGRIDYQEFVAWLFPESETDRDRCETDPVIDNFRHAFELDVY
jgi:serine/threonine protein kinase